MVGSRGSGLWASVPDPDRSLHKVTDTSQALQGLYDYKFCIHAGTDENDTWAEAFRHSTEGTIQWGLRQHRVDSAQALAVPSNLCHLHQSILQSGTIILMSCDLICHQD